MKKKKLKILIVDDEENIRLFLRDNLHFEGYEICEAGDGREALDKAEDCNPDLIILDIMLPKRSGLDCLREIRASGIHTPAIVITARVDAELTIRGVSV